MRAAPSARSDESARGGDAESIPRLSTLSLSLLLI
jgi:hypothetical protein